MFVVRQIESKSNGHGEAFVNSYICKKLAFDAKFSLGNHRLLFFRGRDGGSTLRRGNFL